MENLDEVFQQKVGVEWGFLEIGHFHRVAVPNMVFLERFELSVGGEVLLQLFVGQIRWTAALDEPEVGSMCFLKDGLERERHRAALGIVGEAIVGPCILVEAT